MRSLRVRNTLLLHISIIISEMSYFVCCITSLDDVSIHHARLSETGSYIHSMRSLPKHHSWEKSQRHCETFHSRLAWIPETLLTNNARSIILKNQLAKALEPHTKYYINLYSNKGVWYWSGAGDATLQDKKVSQEFVSKMMLRGPNYQYGVLVTGSNNLNISIQSETHDLAVQFLCEQVTCQPYKLRHGEIFKKKSYSLLAPIFVGATVELDCLQNKRYTRRSTVSPTFTCLSNSTWSDSPLCLRITKNSDCPVPKDWLPLVIYTMSVTIFLSLGISGFVFNLIQKEAKTAHNRRFNLHDAYEGGAVINNRDANTAQAEIYFIEKADVVFYMGHPLKGRTYRYHSVGVKNPMRQMEIESAWIMAITDGRKSEVGPDMCTSRLLYLPDINDVVTLPPSISFNEFLCHIPTSDQRLKSFFHDVIIPLIADLINKSHDEVQLRMDMDLSPEPSNIDSSTSESQPESSSRINTVKDDLSDKDKDKGKATELV